MQRGQPARHADLDPLRRAPRPLPEATLRTGVAPLAQPPYSGRCQRTARSIHARENRLPR